MATVLNGDADPFAAAVRRVGTARGVCRHRGGHDHQGADAPAAVMMILRMKLPLVMSRDSRESHLSRDLSETMVTVGQGQRQ